MRPLSPKKKGRKKFLPTGHRSDDVLHGWSDGFGPREQAAVDGVDHRSGADLSTAEKSTVEAFDGILSALDAIELEIDVALRVWI